jgi:hypothetical protein
MLKRKDRSKCYKCYLLVITNLRIPFISHENAHRETTQTLLQTHYKLEDLHNHVLDQNINLIRKDKQISF